MSVEKQPVDDSQLKKLREDGLLKSNEVAWINGDLVIAENVLTSEKRVLCERSLLFESKRLLKG